MEGDADKENRDLPLIAAKERGPGPGRYKLPSTCGFTDHDFTKYTNAAYSFGRRTKLLDHRRGPGPAYGIDPAITKHGKDGTPAYSMLARQQGKKIFNTPSPGAYCPERVHPQGEKHAPKYSIGSRTRYRKTDNNPSSNKYKLPPILGATQPNKQSSSAYSLIGRREIGSYLEDLAKAPGPGHYHATSPDTFINRAPLYSMRRRSYMPGDRTKKPGPGAHCPEKVTINKRSAPVFSLGIRHSEFICPMVIDVQD
ncbi:hypothetical protein LOTGIDRAFT_207007 [Lottia gigantea]|uniref:Outer dense fiber protein 3 n=1 Tax=Lottia gigantea TaxID=225164 RepID=V3ZT86_LOTGI|nr:hypothetical protein LOTGIDRAFT_207007 [Lottia gigantea]ESO87577.1 hypothetical protein LOTGIDRAFT_207007 [Lottia gigantea]